MRVGTVDLGAELVYVDHTVVVFAARDSVKVGVQLLDHWVGK